MIFRWSYFDGCTTKHYCEQTHTFSLNHQVLPCCTNYQVMNGTKWYKQITNANETLGVFSNWVNDVNGDCALNMSQITGNLYVPTGSESFTYVANNFTFVPHVPADRS